LRGITVADTVIANPTYIEHVRHFFEDVDLEHMFKRGYDLTTYPTLKANAQAVIDQTRPPEAAMPPEPERKWTERIGRRFPLRAAGDPTINARLLLQDSE